jgi:hypothetical protein
MLCLYVRDKPGKVKIRAWGTSYRSTASSDGGGGGNLAKGVENLKGKKLFIRVMTSYDLSIRVLLGFHSFVET